MGKVTISEPVKGESLTATKLNSTIDSWQLQTQSINQENVHDQAIDNFNMAADSVRFVNPIAKNGDRLFFFKSMSSNPRSYLIACNDELFDFTANDYILRVSVNLYSVISIGLTTPIAQTFTATASLKYKVVDTMGTSRKMTITSRTIEIRDDQCARARLDESLTIVTHLNKYAPLEGGSNLEIKFYLEIDFSYQNLVYITRDGVEQGALGYFAEIETIKR